MDENEEFHNDRSFCKKFKRKRNQTIKRRKTIEQSNIDSKNIRESGEFGAADNEVEDEEVQMERLRVRDEELHNKQLLEPRSE